MPSAKLATPFIAITASSCRATTASVLMRLPLLQRLADAEHGRETGLERRTEFARHQHVILVIEAPALRVPDDHVSATHILQHGGGHLSRERADRLGTHVLRAHSDIRPSSRRTASAR